MTSVKLFELERKNTEACQRTWTCDRFVLLLSSFASHCSEKLYRSFPYEL